MKKKYYFILALIFFIGIFFRFYKLGEVPSGFHRDEAFLGYNAYSLLITGKDMTGNFLPIHLASFLYTPAGYAYLTIPFISVFGLNEFSTQISSALFGALTVLLFFFFNKELFRQMKKNGNDDDITKISIISSFFMAVSPWCINLSRTASVITVVVFLIILGSLFFLYWIRLNKIKYLIISFLSFFISLFFYIAPYSFLPLFIPLLIFFFVKVNNHKRKLVTALLFYVIFILAPLIFTLSSKDLSLRVRTLSLTNFDGVKLIREEQIRGDGVSQVTTFESRFFHNKYLGNLSQFIDNYSKHFSYDFLFSDKGYPDRYRVPLAGLFYFFELPLLGFGTFILLKNQQKLGLFLLGWLMIGPIGSAMTADDLPNLQRTLFVIPPFLIIISYGANDLIKYLDRFTQKIRYFWLCLFCLIVLISVIFYTHQYFVHAVLYRPWYRQDGYKELAYKLNQLLPRYKKAVITDRESAPTIFFLFYSKYSPSLFQGETKNSKFRDFDRINFGKYEFSQEECPLKNMIIKDAKSSNLIKKGYLYVNSGLCEIPENATVLDVIKRKDNSIVFYILKEKS